MKTIPQMIDIYIDDSFGAAHQNANKISKERNETHTHTQRKIEIAKIKEIETRNHSSTCVCPGS